MTTPTQELTAQSSKEDVSVERFLAMPAEHRFELLDGKLVRRNMGAESSEVAALIARWLGNWSDSRSAGRFYGADGGYRIFGVTRNRVRYPDVSFVAASRLQQGRSPRGLLLVPPDVAIEVVSPRDRAGDVEQKRIEFLEAGTKAYWIVYPQTRTVHIFRSGGFCQMQVVGDEIRDQSELLEFVCRVDAVFQ